MRAALGLHNNPTYRTRATGSPAAKVIGWKCFSAELALTNSMLPPNLQLITEYCTFTHCLTRAKHSSK